MFTFWLPDCEFRFSSNCSFLFFVSFLLPPRILRAACIYNRVFWKEQEVWGARVLLVNDALWCSATWNPYLGGPVDLSSIQNWNLSLKAGAFCREKCLLVLRSHLSPLPYNKMFAFFYVKLEWWICHTNVVRPLFFWLLSTNLFIAVNLGLRLWAFHLLWVGKSRRRSPGTHCVLYIHGRTHEICVKGCWRSEVCGSHSICGPQSQFQELGQQELWKFNKYQNPRIVSSKSHFSAKIPFTSPLESLGHRGLTSNHVWGTLVASARASHLWCHDDCRGGNYHGVGDVWIQVWRSPALRDKSLRKRQIPFHFNFLSNKRVK